MKKSSLLVILAMCSFMCLSGCDSSDSDHYYNVNYIFDIGEHKFNVYLPKKDSQERVYSENLEDMFDTYVVPMSNYQYIAFSHYDYPVIELNGRRIEVQNEFYKNTSTLYVYGKL